MIPRVIPVLLLEDGGLVKTVKFREPRYVGDPINAVRIFNEKQVDELIVLEIRASREGRSPDETSIAEIAGEAFMPIGYGGGVRDLQTATRLIQLGVEKVVVNTAAVEAPNEVARIADRLGRSTLVVSIDAERRPDGTYEVVTHGATHRTGIDVRTHAEVAATLGAGEMFVTAIDRDGTMEGYDLDLIRQVTDRVDVPVIACGGAGSPADLVAAIREGGADAAAAGSLFVFHGRHRAVLITYPPYDERVALFSDAIPELSSDSAISKASPCRVSQGPEVQAVSSNRPEGRKSAAGPIVNLPRVFSRSSIIAPPARTICTRCIMDLSDPDILFDGDGICNHCRHADLVLAAVRWTPATSEQALKAAADRIRRGADGEYDSVIGLSGGVDSSYVGYLAHRLGLRPLAVHVDNGWDSELAVENIQRIVEGCSFDLISYVIDWREFRDLQRAFLRASVVDIELLTDHAILAATARVAREHGIRRILSGTNVATEHGLPASWTWNKLDWTNIQAIHDAYGSVPLRTFPHTTTSRWLAMRLTGRIKMVELLNLVPFRRDEAAAALEREFGWREYMGKHGKSMFTKFYQGAILPRKFGIDKRRVHLSDRIRNGELTRNSALALVAGQPYAPDELRTDGDYVRKKLGFDEAEWETIMTAPPRRHDSFATDRGIPSTILLPLRVARRLRRLLRATSNL